MDLVRHLVEWAYEQQGEPLPASAVPGTSSEERIALMAVGGIARVLAGDRCTAWPDALKVWASAAPEPPRALMESVRRELDGGKDVLALLYEGIVSGRNRRRLGTFFTPASVVDFMLDTAEKMIPQPAVVIDPGAGVGAFSLAAKRRWPMAQVFAIDVNVATLGLLAARPQADINLVHQDYLAWSVGQSVPASKPRLWIGNPPYTRHQELSADLKGAASKASGDLVTSGLAGLSAYFLAVTLATLAPQDAMCLLLPGSWTEARYGKPLRKKLRDMTDRRVELIGFGSEVDVFPGTRVTAMMVVVGPREAVAAQKMRTSVAHLTASAVSVGRSVDRSRQDGAVEGMGGWLWPRKRSVVADSVSLSEVARVRRGVATGANEFFLLTAVERAKYPEVATVRAIRRLRNVSGDHLTLAVHNRLADLGERCWLLRINDPSLLANPAVEDWMRRATDAQIPDRYLASHREPWYEVEAVEPPDLILSPMGKTRMRAVVNHVRAIPSNALYGVYLDGNLEQASRLAAWLNGAAGQTALLERARTYGAGLFKLEPKDVLVLRIPRVLPKGESPVVRPPLPTEMSQ